MRSNLFVVESPLQALSAYEARESLCSDEKSVVLVRLWGGKRKENDEQIKRVIDLSGWKRIVYFNTRSKTVMGMHVKILNNIAKTSRILKGQASSIFIGDFYSEWMHYLKCVVQADDVFLLDDGSNTIAAYNESISKGVNWPRKSRSPARQRLHNLIYSCFYNKDYAENKIKIFSSFDLGVESPYVIKNQYSELKKRMGKKILEEREVYYFGAKYSESGVMGRQAELEFLEKVIKFYEKLGKLFIYIPHRDEETGKLNSIKKLGNVLVKNLNMPAELYLVTSERIPSSIGGAYTSVLPNAKVMFDCFSMTSFRIPCSVMHESHRYAVNKIYENYSRSGINVIDV